MNYVNIKIIDKCKGFIQRTIHHELLISTYIHFFPFFTAHKPKTFELRGLSIKNIYFFTVPNSHTQMGSLSLKNASE
jgi:hypothetical protein